MYILNNYINDYYNNMVIFTQDIHECICFSVGADVSMFGKNSLVRMQPVTNARFLNMSRNRKNRELMQGYAGISRDFCAYENYFIRFSYVSLICNSVTGP
jgi:hypothetical protein